MTIVDGGFRSPALVSVVVPVRNGGRWIGAQLGALAEQEYVGAWEVVVVDGGKSALAQVAGRLVTLVEELAVEARRIREVAERLERLLAAAPPAPLRDG